MSYEISDFLDLLYGEDAVGYTTVSVRRADGSFVNKTFWLQNRDEIVGYISSHSAYDIYIKRSSQHKPPERGSGRADIAYMQRALTADIDYQSDAHSLSTLPPSKEAALELLKESGLPEPTLIVHTGNGLMPMWILREPAWVHHTAPIQNGIEAQLRLAAARRGWTLDKTSDAARAIRVAGTYNWKQRPTKKPVAVLRRSDRHYDLADFAPFARAALLAPKRTGGAATKETIQALLRHIPGDGLEYNKWLAAVWAVQSALSEEDAEELLDAWTYDWRPHSRPEAVESGGIGVLINLARENGYEGAVPGVRGGHITLPELPDAVRVTQRYLDIEIEPSDDYPNIVVIRSPKGTGKTQWLRAVAECYRRVLSVGHRVSLVRQNAKRLNLTPYYEDGKWITDAPRVATTIHSLDKIETKEPYEVVIIDEIEQVLKALVNDKNLKNRKVHALGALMEHLRRAKLIVFTDADIGEATLTFLNVAFGDRPISFIENEYRHRMIDHLVLNPSPEDVMVKALEWRRQMNCRIALACNTRADADRAELFFSENAPDARLLKITSETGGENNETLENINERLADVDIFIYSPSVGTGVSIDVEGFALFGIARNGVGVGDVDDFRQQLGRIRKPFEREINLYVEPKQMDEPTSPEAYRDLVKLRELEADFRFTRANGEPEPQSEWDSVYLALYCVVKAKTAAQKNRFFDNLVGAYAAEGVEVWDDRKDDDARKLTDDERVELRKRLDEQRRAKERERAERIVAAPTPDEAETKQEKADAERKVELEERYGIDVDADLVLDDERGAYKDAQRFAAVEASEVAEYLDANERGRRFSADRSYFALFAFWCTTLLTALKLRIEEGAEIAITEEFLDLVERNRIVIQAALGVRVRSDFRKRPMTFVGAMLRKIGIETEGEQRRVNGERVRTYRLVNVDRARLRATGIRKRYEEAKAAKEAPVLDFLGVAVKTGGKKTRKAGCHNTLYINSTARVVTAAVC